MAQSKKWHLNEADWQAWFEKAVEWLKPVAAIYLAQVAIYLQDGFQVADFIPNTALQGVIALYVVNQLYGLSKRAKAGK